MAAPKESNKETGKEPDKEASKEAGKDKSRVVKFAQVETDQSLWQAIEQSLSQQPQSSFSDLCKQALHHYLQAQLAPDSPPPPELTIEVSALQRQVITLQKQIRALQLQIAKLEGAIGMQQTLTLGTLEQQMVQLEQRLTQQTRQLTDRISQLEAQEPQPGATVEVTEPIELDPLLTRLVPLLEDF